MRCPAMNGLHSEQAVVFTLGANVRPFVMRAKPWVVDNSHACSAGSRRIVGHHDRLAVTFATWMWTARARRLVHRLSSWLLLVTPSE